MAKMMTLTSAGRQGAKCTTKAKGVSQRAVQEGHSLPPD